MPTGREATEYRVRCAARRLQKSHTISSYEGSIRGIGRVSGILLPPPPLCRLQPQHRTSPTRKTSVSATT